jgi:hypothetical protein
MVNADLRLTKTLTTEKRDEALSCPPLSTREPGKSGKLGVAYLVRKPIQAHLQAVFGTKDQGKDGLQSPEILRFIA